MPPKSSNKKQTTPSWFHCDRCEVHITPKERETHEKVCPIDVNSFQSGSGLECIASKTLYTCGVERRTFTIEELVDMPEKYVNRMVFLSEGAMRLAQLHIGQNVTIEVLGSENSATLVRTVWPIPEKFLTSVFVTSQDFQLNWEQLKGAPIKISGMSGENIAPAKTVQFQMINTQEENVLNEQQMRDVRRTLKQEIKHLIYSNGNFVHLNFFNKNLQFKINSWEAFDTSCASESTLEEALNKLSLAYKLPKDECQPKFFQIVPTTQIEVLSQQSKDIELKESQSRDAVITSEDIGGLDDEFQLIEESIEIGLALRDIPKGVKISRGLLIYGPTGCGKTLLCEALSQDMRCRNANIVKINTSELFSKFLGETEKNLSQYFDQAYRNYPKATLIVIEDVHNLCPKHESNEVVRRVSVAFLSILDDLSNKKEAQHTFLLATTSNIEALHSGIRRCGRFDSEVEISAPSPKGRAQILKCLLRKVEHNLNYADIEAIATNTHGFVGADLSNLIYSASLAALKTQQTHLTLKNLNSCLAYIKPSAMREVLIENPNVRWSDIGGQESLKLQLKQAIEWPLLHADKFKQLGIKPPRGLLMYGPPGCSKTMIAKALATESKLNFLSIKGPELFSMWVGESERAVREVFRKARQVAPSIVFFDEIDAISGERAEGGVGGGGGSGSSVKERVLTQLLTEMDGVESLQNVTIVAATNRPDMIDKALLRPGRIDRIVYVGLPNAEARHEIFRIKLSAMPLAADVDIKRLVDATDGYSGAEIQAICHEAALKAIELSFDAKEVSWMQFEYALSAVKPRTSSELLQIYLDYMKRS